jgi:hypothetical protein
MQSRSIRLTGRTSVVHGLFVIRAHRSVQSGCQSAKLSSADVHAPLARGLVDGWRWRHAAHRCDPLKSVRLRHQRRCRGSTADGDAAGNNTSRTPMASRRYHHTTSSPAEAPNRSGRGQGASQQNDKAIPHTRRTACSRSARRHSTVRDADAAKCRPGWRVNRCPPPDGRAARAISRTDDGELRQASASPNATVPAPSWQSAVGTVWL